MIHNNIPAYFWSKPDIVKTATISGNECFFGKDFVESLPITITDTNIIEIKFKHGAKTRKDFMAPSFDYNTLLWVSKNQNDNPTGLTTNVMLNNPVVISLTQNQNRLVFAANGKPPILRIIPGNYFINIWYSGSNNGVYLNRELTIQS